MKNKSVVLVLLGVAGFALLARSAARRIPWQAGANRFAPIKMATGMASAAPPGSTATIAIRPSTLARSRPAISRMTTATVGRRCRRLPAPALDPSRCTCRRDLPDGSETGAADEKPVHRVAGSAFVMDRYEVTNARYQHV